MNHVLRKNVQWESTIEINLGPSDAIWRWRSWSTLVQVMACCLTAPSHYLNQCWLIISKVLWHSSQDIIIRRFKDSNQRSKIENCIFKITLRSPRGQWVNTRCRQHEVNSNPGNPTLWSGVPQTRITNLSVRAPQAANQRKSYNYLKYCIHGFLSILCTLVKVASTRSW